MIRSLVGHGIGREMHEDPQIPNFGEPGKGPLIEEGMVFCIEPMVCAGAPRRAAWETTTGRSTREDGSLTAHFEHTVAVTAEGPRILTPWHLKEQRRRRLSGPEKGQLPLCQASNGLC